VTVSCEFAKETTMPQRFGQPFDGDPTAAEIFRVFRNTTAAGLEGLRLLLEECTLIRAELVAIHGKHGDGHDHRVFSARQHDRMLELQEAAKDIEALVATLP